MIRFKSLLILIGSLLTISTSAAGADWYVSKDGQGDTTTIQDAIDLASPGDVVYVGPGVYQDLHPDSFGKLVVVELRSGIEVRSLEGPATTILDADLESGERRGVSAYYVDSGGLLTGFTIRKGDTYTGAGIYLEGSDARIVENWILDNYAGEGGGMAVSGLGSPLVAGNRIEDNTACCAPAGGIYVFAECSPIIEDNHLARNFGFTGGGIGCVDAGAAIIRRNTIVGNDALAGGAIGLVNSPILAEENWMIENTADVGGGVAVQGLSPATFRRNVVARNTARGDGGGYHLRDNDSLLDHETIVDNGAWTGAGVYCWYGANPTIQNSLVVFGRSGDGIYADDFESIPVLSCTNVFGNELGEFGGVPFDPLGVDGNVSIDPRFCDLDQGSYILAPRLIEPACGTRGALSGSCATIHQRGSASNRSVSGLLATPNPSRGVVRLLLNAESIEAKGDREAGTIQIFSVSGRLIRKLEGLPTIWDRTDASGRLVGPGVYWARTHSAAGEETGSVRIVLVR